MSSSEKLSYKVSGDKVTIEGKVDDGKFTFEGKASKKGNSYDIEGHLQGRTARPPALTRARPSKTRG